MNLSSGNIRDKKLQNYSIQRVPFEECITGGIRCGVIDTEGFVSSDDDITPCLAPPTEGLLDGDDEHETEVGEHSKAAKAGQKDCGYSLLLYIVSDNIQNENDVQVTTKWQDLLELLFATKK